MMDERSSWKEVKTEHLESNEPAWEGKPKRECGDHYTTGLRAWCHTCTEWCYPEMPCLGCGFPEIEEERNDLLRTQSLNLDRIAKLSDEVKRQQNLRVQMRIHQGEQQAEIENLTRQIDLHDYELKEANAERDRYREAVNRYAAFVSWLEGVATDNDWCQECGVSHETILPALIRLQDELARPTPDTPQEGEG